MRALLIVNPSATATTSRSRDVVASALSSELKLDVALTDHRGHAAELARQARLDGLELVVALGGDGTVNEAVNGLLADGKAADVPLFAAIPCGSTNVFARNLGMTNNAVEATGELLEALAARRFRSIGLGTVKADDRDPRWFTFTAGVGFDAAVVRRVERVRHSGTRASGTLYMRSAMLEFILKENKKDPALVLEIEGEEPVPGIFYSVISNSSPWSYLGRRPLNVSPQASFDGGLDIYAMLRARAPLALTRALQALSHKGPRGKHTLLRTDLPSLRFTASRPMPLQGDGDDFGDASRIQLCSEPNALRVPRFKTT